MKYSKVSNTFFTATIKNLLVMPFALLVISWDAGDTKLGGINFDELENKKGLFYLKESDDPYTGGVFELYENGKKKTQGSFKDGKPEGLMTIWHRNGLKKTEGSMKDGKPEGLMTEWYESGQKRYEENWKDGKKGGLMTSWYESGQKKNEENWKDGKKEGLMTSWHKNGKKKTERIFGSSYSPPRFWNSKGQEVDSWEDVNPNLKYVIEGDTVTITGCAEDASGELIIAAKIEGKPVTSIGKAAFHGCMRLTAITIPNGVTSIGNGAFFSCARLTSITIPNSVTSIGYRAFSFCSALTSITIPDGVTSIGWDAFSFCRALTSITIPDGVTSIGYKAFHNCTSLTSITIPDSVTSIKERAFYGCTSLKSITIPDSVTSIGDWAFWNCTSLTAVTFLGDAPKIEDRAFEKSAPTIYRKADAKGWGDTFAGRPVKLITEKPVEEKLTADEVLEIANQPHQPIVDIPQLITAKLKVGMWERETTFDINESSSQKAKSINRKSLKRIKHVKGKYVVIQTYDEKGNKVFTEVHSYNKKAEKLISVGISAKGKSSRIIGIPDLKKHSIKWVKQSAQSDQILQILITCSQDGKSFQIKGSDKVGKKIIASWAGVAKWTDNLNVEVE